MIKTNLLILVLIYSVSNHAQATNEIFTWPGGNKLAVSLSYDDALNSQLDNVIPELDKYNLKASFYIVPNAPTFNDRIDEWRALAENGHELGNHSVYHPCRGSLPNRDWVQARHDLDSYSISQIIEELTIANTFLKAIDGKSERTYTIPCGDLLVGGEEYLSKINHLFTAIKGHGKDKRLSLIFYPEGKTGKQLIEQLKKVPSDILLVNIIFHGVGGDYLSVSSKAHAEFLSYLANNRESYYVDSYLNLMKYVENKKEGL
jgi:hypothetical protein